MNLKSILEKNYTAFDRSKLEPDPLQFPHRFRNKNDIEIAAFISSIFAYGNVTQIVNTLNKIFTFLGTSPYKFILDLNSKEIKKIEFPVHRFYSSMDVQRLFLLLSIALKEYGSLKKVFYENLHLEDENLKTSISEFSKYFLNLYKENVGSLTNGIKFMFPLPEKGSACKRMNLFLRWMVRKDDLDLGLWNEIPTCKLVIPVDTHIAKICKRLKLTNLKNVSWRMAEEITNNLKMYDKNDPVKYDFALCHIGIRKLKM